MLSLLIAAYHTIPVTGRAVLSIASEDEVIKKITEAFQSINIQNPKSRNPKYNVMVKELGKRIVMPILGYSKCGLRICCL